MDYKELADLIFPNAKDISYYEEKYPKRNLPEGAIVSRFAPSPTGFVHIGGIYQALVARMVTTQTNGVFFLRIEDTDQKREVENGIVGIINALKDFDLSADEGMISENDWIGDYGTYKQSDRKEIYEAYAKYMIANGKAYPCFCTVEENEEMRKKQEAAKIRPGYYGPWATCRHLTLEQMAENVKSGKRFVIRFKSPGREDKKVVCKDLIKGKVVFPENDLDIPIIKSDGLPTYHFAHLVDDHLMRTTHIIRSDEWLPSLPLHVQLFQEAGFELPKYCHISPIMKNDNGNKRKLSKRKDPESAVSYYEEVGMPSDAVKEYLLNIANSSFENWRRQNPDVDMKEFKVDLSKMSVSGALFDMHKILDVSKSVISRYTAEEVYEKAYNWAARHDEDLKELLNDKEYALKVLGIERGTVKPRKDIAIWSELKDNIIYMYEMPNVYDFDEKFEHDEIIEILKAYKDMYSEDVTNTEWFDTVKDLAEKFGYAREVKEYKKNPEAYKGHVGDISAVIRMVITGRKNTPDLYQIMKVIGKDEVINRIDRAIEIL